MYVEKQIRSLTKTLDTAFWMWNVILWVTISVSLAYFAWLALFRDLLEPVFAGGSVIQLDLLQTLVFFVAVTALGGTVVVATMNKIHTLASEVIVSQIWDSGDLVEHRPSRLRRAIDLGPWIWCIVQLGLAILILCQGVAEASLSSSRENVTYVVIGGWLAAACAGSWVVIVIVASAMFTYLYVEVRHVVAVVSEWRQMQRESSNS